MQWYSVVCIAPIVVDGVRGISSLIRSRASLSCWTFCGTLRSNTMSHRCSVAFRSSEVRASQWCKFLYPPGTACILSPYEAGHCRAAGDTQDCLHQRRV